MLNLQSTISRSSDQVGCDLDGEETILNLKNGKYYGLAHVGARVWTLLESPRQVQYIHSQLLQEFEVDSKLCLQDLLKLLQSLADEGLVEISS